MQLFFFPYRTFELDENDALLKYIHSQLLPPLKPGQHRPTLQRATAQRAAQAIGEVSEQDKLLTELTNILKEVGLHVLARHFFTLQLLLLSLIPFKKPNGIFVTLLSPYNIHF